MLSRIVLHQQAREASEQPARGASPSGVDDAEDEDAPEPGKARNINTGEPQYQEALLRKRIGTTVLASLGAAVMQTSRDSLGSVCSVEPAEPRLHFQLAYG